MGAIVLSLFDTMYYVYAGLPGLLTTVNAISAQNPMSFPGMLLGTLATIVVTIALVQVVGNDIGAVVEHVQVGHQVFVNNSGTDPKDRDPGAGDHGCNGLRFMGQHF